MIFYLKLEMCNFFEKNISIIYWKMVNKGDIYK